MFEKFYYNSPVGVLEITTEENFLTSLKIVETFKEVKVLNDFQKNISQQLSEYFNSKRKNFNIKIKPKGTPFQQKVWNALIKIPYGTTKSYKDIACEIKNPNAQRAIGNACNKNPILIIIPCHRVISKTGNLTGFAYGIDNKKILIDLEKQNHNCL